MSFTRPSETREPVLAGTISVQQLAHPLEGKGLSLLRKAKDLIDHGQIARGMEQLRAAMREPSAEPHALSMLAVEHLKVGDFDTAITELETANGLMPGLAANHSNLAYALSAVHRTDEALIHARKALQLHPGHARTRYVLGQILLQLGQREEAEFHLRRAAEELPSARKLLVKYFTPEAQAR